MLQFFIHAVFAKLPRLLHREKQICCYLIIGVSEKYVNEKFYYVFGYPSKVICKKTFNGIKFVPSKRLHC